MKLHELIRRIQSKSDLAAFIEALAEDLRSHPDDWENHTLDRYVAALARWVADSDGFYANQGLEAPTAPSWRNVGEMLLAAKTYE